MSKGRIPGAERKTRSPRELSHSPVVRYLGLSLSGGKSDKSCLAVLEHYPEQRRIFLSRLHERIRSEETVSADTKILEMIDQMKDVSRVVAFDAPLTLPKCLTCPKICPGYEVCDEPEVAWMRKRDQNHPRKRTRRMFTPYTQRPVDLYLSEVEEENLEVQHALGANLAPLTARAQYLKRRISLPCLEVFPKLAVWRMGLELKVTKAHLRSYRNALGGEEGRRAFLSAFIEKTGLFVYQQDQRLLVENVHAFDALISAWVAYLKDQNKTEAPPADFPEPEAWVEFPKKKTF